MTTKTIKVCDNGRCGKEIGPGKGPYIKITFHAHHERTIELCLPCFDTMRRWLEPNMVAPGRDPKEIEEHRDDLAVLGHCLHGYDLDNEFCPQGCRV